MMVLQSLMKLLKKLLGSPAALVRALSVERIIENRQIATPWRGKLLHAQLIEMKNRKRYVQLLLVDGDVDMRVAIDATGAGELQAALSEFLSKMDRHSEDKG